MEKVSSIFSECSICLEMIEGDATKVIICNHNFHTECIIKWADDNNTCPNCRRVIDEKKRTEIRNDEYNNLYGELYEEDSYYMEFPIFRDNFRERNLLESPIFRRRREIGVVDTSEDASEENSDGSSSEVEGLDYPDEPPSENEEIDEMDDRVIDSVFSPRVYINRLAEEFMNNSRHNVRNNTGSDRSNNTINNSGSNRSNNRNNTIRIRTDRWYNPGSYFRVYDPVI